MKLRYNRYSPDMLVSLSSQSLLSIIINAVVRGILFVVVLQLIALASVGAYSSPLQMAVLALVFGFIVFSVDMVERAWAQFALRNRP